MDRRPSTKTTDARNRKLNIHTTAVVPLGTSPSHTSKCQKSNKGRKQPSEKQHQCKVCGKSFRICKSAKVSYSYPYRRKTIHVYSM